MDFETVVRLVKLGNPAGGERLQGMLEGGIRLFICRSLGIDNSDDLVQEALLTVLEAIQNDTLRDPNALVGFARGVVKNLVRREIRTRTSRREQPMDPETMGTIRDFGRTPEGRVMDQENIVLMQSALASLSERDREILVRFYIREQTPEQIMSEMGLSPTQFRLAKNRAKARFAALGKRKLASQRNQFRPA